MGARHNKKWSVRDLAIASTLARGGTRTTAAHAGGVSVRTVFRLCADPRFQRLIQEFRGEILPEALSLLDVPALGKLLDQQEFEYLSTLDERRKRRQKQAGRPLSVEEALTPGERTVLTMIERRLAERQKDENDRTVSAGVS